MEMKFIRMKRFSLCEFFCEGCVQISSRFRTTKNFKWLHETENKPIMFNSFHVTFKKKHPVPAPPPPLPIKIASLPFPLLHTKIQGLRSKKCTKMGQATVSPVKNVCPVKISCQ